METKILKEMLSVVRSEQQRREALLDDEDPNFAYDQWLFTDKPFINELCIVLLVTLRHQVEKELVSLAARAMDDGKEIDSNQYWENVNKLKKRSSWDWTEINNRIKPELCEGHEHMKALRLIANSYKHDPSTGPNNDLLNLLELEIGVNCASLAESDALRAKLAEFIDLDKDADFCDIVERFVEIAGDFLANVQSGTKLSPVKRLPVSLNPKDFAR